MDQVSRKTLPPGYGYEWSGHGISGACRHRDRPGAILGLSVLFAFLFLVALYESWTIPIPVLLSVTVGVLGAFVGLAILGAVAGSVCADRHGGADRAGGEERHPDRRVRQGGCASPGLSIHDAAALGARMRIRAVLMTSIAFIFGLVPLVWATGAAMLSRRAVGTAVFAGMIVASSIGVFLIPMLYVVFQTTRERVKRRFGGSIRHR